MILVFGYYESIDKSEYFHSLTDDVCNDLDFDVFFTLCGNMNEVDILLDSFFNMHECFVVS